MTVGSIIVSRKERPGRRTARRLVAGGAYRRIAAGRAPDTLADFAVEFSAWLKDAYPGSSAATVKFVEDAIRDTCIAAMRRSAASCATIATPKQQSGGDVR
jgi:hypothetical protein